MGRWTRNAQWVIVGILPLFLGLAIFKLAHYRTDRDHVLEDQAARFRVEYQTILNCLQGQALFAFNESVNQQDVLAEVHAAWHAPDQTSDQAQRTRHRDRLQALMEPTFANLQAAGFRQFHFHFPDGSSFLRLHRPERFGDSLAEIRETVVAVNRDHLPIIGFEEGRIFNAYRNVFPLSFEGEHVGSVEISFSLLGIRSTLEDLIGGRHQLLMSKNVVQEKVFSEEQSNYAAWPWSDSYLLDIESSHPSLFPDLAAVKNQDKLRRRIEAGLQSGQDFGIPLRLESTSFILQFTAICNFTGRQTAFWVFLHESPPLEDLRIHVIFTTTVSLFIIFLLGGAILWINRMHNKLKEIESFLPVCATCKKVRQVDSDSSDPCSWISIEEYFTRQTDAQITHGICPDCLRQAMKENDL